MMRALIVPLPLQDQLHQRYVGSFKRQFKEQEVRSLQHRTRHRPGQAGPDCVCLVAIKKSDSSSAEVVGTLDVEPPGSALAQKQKVPEVRLSPSAGSIVEGDQSIYLQIVITTVARKLRLSLGLSSAGRSICAQRGGLQQAQAARHWHHAHGGCCQHGKAGLDLQQFVCPCVCTE